PQASSAWTSAAVSRIAAALRSSRIFSPVLVRTTAETGKGWLKRYASAICTEVQPRSRARARTRSLRATFRALPAQPRAAAEVATAVLVGGEEPGSERRPGEDGQLGALMEAPRLAVRRAGDAHRAGPRRTHPVHEREVWTAGGHRRKPRLPCHWSDGLDAGDRPVRDAPGLDLPRPVRGGQRLDDRLQRRTREVAVEQVEVEPVDPEPAQAGVEIPRERLRGEPVRAQTRVGMSALADEEQ